ncbi:MAG: ATP-binding protein [Ignavibacteriales bacterium]|nr:ATP-binding protein [Ignavibacteriales bacterium]
MITLLGYAKAIPTLSNWYKTLRAKINFPSKYEDVLYRSMKDAIEEVTGQDVSRNDIGEKIEVYEAAILFFNNSDVSEERIKELLYSSNEKIKIIEDKFIANLIKNGDPELNTFILTQVFPRLDSIESKVEDGFTFNKTKLEKIESNTEALSKSISEIGKYFAASLDETKGEYTLENRIVLFKAPQIPKNFIKRTETISALKKLFDKEIIFIHGITRSGKSFLISEMIYDENLLHFWYDFKLNKTNGDNFLYLSLINYILNNESEPNIGKYVIGNNFNFIAIVDALNKLIEHSKELYIILDNIHLINQPEQLDSFLKLLINKCKDKIYIYLISEEKDTYKSFSSNIQNIHEFHSAGFSVNEIKEFFEANGISTGKASQQFLEMIHYNSNDGHPDILNGLILELKSKNVSSLLSTETISHVLDSFKHLPAQQKITKILTDKIFSNVLHNDDQKNTFIRLCCLVGVFSRDLAQVISRINPPITNFHLIFPELSEKIFDIHSGSKYSIPKVFRDTATDFLTKELKSIVYINAAKYLSTPRGGVLNFHEGKLACFYLFLAEQTSAALSMATEFLRRVLLKYEQVEYLRNALDEFEIYVSLPIEDQYLNEMMSHLMLTLEAYKLLDDKTKLTEIVNKIYSKLNSPKLDSNLRFIAAAELIFFHLKENQSQIQKIIESSVIFLDGLDSNLLPKGMELKIEKGTFVISVVAYLLVDDLPRIGDVNKFLTVVLQKNITVGHISNRKIIVDIFEIFWIKLYKKIESSGNVTQALQDFEHELGNTKAIFSEIKLVIGLRELNHLLGVLYTDFAPDPLDAVEFLKEAQQNNDDLISEDTEFLARNYLTLGDAYFKAKKYEPALTNYLSSEESFDALDNEVLLKVHNNIRVGICYYELGENLKAEKYFWKAFLKSRSAKESSAENIFMALTELSTYYINSEEYLKATKCFSIILEVLSDIEHSAKDQLVGQSLNWLKKSIDEKKPDLKTYIDGGKEFHKPYWGMYRNPKYKDARATKLSTLLSLAMVFNSLKKHYKARSIYRKIISSSDIEEFDLMAKYLSVYFLIIQSIECDDYNELIFCFENIIPISIQYNSAPFDTIFKLPKNDILGAVYFSFINPIKKKYMRKYDDVEQFIKVEKFFLKLVKISKILHADFNDTLFTEITSAFGWLYGLNIQLDTSYRETAITWLDKSNETALQIGRIEAYINNKNLELFQIPIISDLKKYLREVFAYLLFVKDYIDKKDLVLTTLGACAILLKGIKAKKPSESEMTLLEDFRGATKQIEVDETNYKDKFISLIQCFFKHRFILNLDKEKLITLYPFILENVATVNESELNELFENYFSIQKDLIRKNISDDNYVIRQNEEMTNHLVSFIRTKGDLISHSLKRTIENKIGELT